ncbi:hypothetical protein B9Z35_12800 [Limnohabitans sp. Jir61]|nr:hypothetical protein B9Z35_12800 [Limnohabitans sp. Jir61]
MMNRFDAHGPVEQTSSGAYVLFSDVEEMRDSLIEFIGNSFDAETGKGLTKDETLKALGVFFRLTLAE